MARSSRMLLIGLVFLLLSCLALPSAESVISAGYAAFIHKYLPVVLKNTSNQEGRRIFLPLVFKAGETCAYPGRAASGATITLCPGQARIVTGVIEFPSLHRTGNSWKAKASATWKVIDARGVGDGWRVDSGKAECHDAIGQPVNYAYFKTRLSNDQVVTVAGNDPPVSNLKNFVPITGNQRLMMYALPGSGMGTYTFTPEFELHTTNRPAFQPYTCTLELLLSPGVVP